MDVDENLEVGRIMARGSTRAFYTNICAPTLDITRDRRWGRVEDTYGEDPVLASRVGVEMVRGLQEITPSRRLPKRHVVYSATKAARGGEARTNPKTCAREVENIFLPPFAAATTEAGLPGRNEFR